MAESEASAPKVNISGAAGAEAIAQAHPLDPRAAAYLEKQGRLADLQSQNLIEQNAFELSHLRWRRFSDQMSGALQVMLAAVGLLIVVALGAAIWSAASDNGLVVEAFSVPPDLAAKGLTGEVIANKVLDRLASFQAQTVTMRASASYANNWGDDIKVQIPDTGVSIGEFNRYLRQWLGHETHISGEIYRTPDGLALSARAGGESTPVFKGSEADIDALIEQAAERVFRSTQPYRYAAWLEDRGRAAESTAILQTIAAGDNARERAWAYNGLAHLTIMTGDIPRADVYARKGIESDPTVLLPQFNLADGEAGIGHEENALTFGRSALKNADAGDPTMDAQALAQRVMAMRLQVAELAGDYGAGLDFARKRIALNDIDGGTDDEMVACALLHDGGCFQAAFASFAPPSDTLTRLTHQGNVQLANAALERWDAVAAAAPQFHAGLLPNPFLLSFNVETDAPPRALAAANLGDVKLALALIAKTPADCVPCLRARGRIDAIAHNWDGAAWWYARAAYAAPSIPMNYSDWGRVLLEKGDAEGAIAKFRIAHEKGSRFADPLEMWGEALMAQNHSDLALSKFSEAAQAAPNWGRLHLKWGEALVWSGDKDEARKQFTIARGLDLTPSETSELARASHG
ncbi:MAG TPA: hypothetical protein VGG48_05510 [Rhizomicrobium sp.]|jgi:tetratricopeptide (TPR) repeat protein